MKKLLSITVFLTVSALGMAQNVDSFEVGPYNVEYKGEGDYRYRLRKDIDLYDYFELKKDTVQVRDTVSIVTDSLYVEPKSPVKTGFQLDLIFATPGHGITGASNVWGLEGAWKQYMTDNLYFNAGLSLALMYGKYSEDWYYMKESMLQVGVPLSFEYSAIDSKKASLFTRVGLVPTYYSTLGCCSDVKKNLTKVSGLYIAPRLEFGAYVPVGGKLLCLGVFAQYNVNFTKEDFSTDNNSGWIPKDEKRDVFAERIGRFFRGIRIGVIF